MLQKCPTICVRRLTRDDVSDLMAVSHQTYKETYLDAYGEAFCDAEIARTRSHTTLVSYVETGFALGAFEGGKLVGYIQVGDVSFLLPPPLEPLRDDAALNHLYVLKTHHNLKIGSRLLNEAVREARTRFKSLYLQVWDENISAIRFYERAGFRYVGPCDGVIEIDCSTFKVAL